MINKIWNPQLILLSLNSWAEMFSLQNWNHVVIMMMHNHHHYTLTMQNYCTFLLQFIYDLIYAMCNWLHTPNANSLWIGIIYVLNYFSATTRIVNDNDALISRIILLSCTINYYYSFDCCCCSIKWLHCFKFALFYCLSFILLE